MHLNHGQTIASVGDYCVRPAPGHIGAQEYVPLCPPLPTHFAAATTRDLPSTTTKTATTTPAPNVWVEGVSSACASSFVNVGKYVWFGNDSLAPLSCVRVLITPSDYLTLYNWCADQAKDHKLQRTRLVQIDTPAKYEWIVGMLKDKVYTHCTHYT
jgi:hypothetical protein